MSGLGDAYAAMQPPRKCICGEYPQGHPSGLCDACVAKRSKPATRQPCAGWVDVSLAIRKQHTSWTDPRIAVWQLPDADCDVLAEVRTWIDDDANSIARWSLDNDRYGNAPTIDAAKLAAEDALLAVADAIRRAVGR